MMAINTYVVDEAHGGSGVANSYGVGCFFPDSKIDLTAYRSKYAFAIHKWDEFLYEYWNGAEPPPPEDTYEPNNSIAEAYGFLNSGTNYVSYISTSTDKDYYKIDAGVGTINIILDGPTGVDYDLALYDYKGRVVASSLTVTADEAISYYSRKGGLYYIYVYGYNGAWSASSYTLRSTFASKSRLVEPIVKIDDYKLNQNYPNPFNPETTISFNVPQTTKLNLNIYNINGQMVRTLANGTYDAGEYNIVWDGNDNNGNSVSTGMYFYKLESEEFNEMKQMLLMK